MNNKFYFDLMPFICEGFSVTPRSYEYIDRIYNKNRLLFKRTAENSKFYGHPISKHGTVKQTHYFNKILGILESKDDSFAEDENYIFEKTFKYENTYVKSSNIINLSHYMERFVKKKRGIDNLSDDDVNTSCLMTFIIAKRLDKEVNTEDPIYNMMISELERRELSCHLEQNQLRKEDRKLVNEFRLKLRHEAPYLFRPNGFVVPEDATEGIAYIIDKLSDTQRIWQMIDSVLDEENLSLAQCVSYDFFRDKEVSNLIKLYLLFNGVDNVNIENMIRDLYIVSQFKYLAREYNKAREYFFSNHNEEYQEEIEKLLIQKEELQKQVINQSSTIDLLNKENTSLNSKVKDLEAIRFDDNSRMELNRLREYVYNMSSETYDEVESDNNIIDAAGLIIGGHINWQNKIAEKLPNFKFVSTDQLNVDTTIINNYEIVLFNTSYLNHSMYYKFINEIRKKGVPFGYIDSTNTNLAVSKIREILKYSK